MSYHDCVIPQNDYKNGVLIPKPSQFIIEGVDRLGKTTLVKNLLNTLGYHLVIHYSKPEKLDFYSTKFDSSVLMRSPEECYQRECNANMFKIIESKANIIFDRGNLGEIVYAQAYRQYSGDYVHELERNTDTDHVRLVLLTTSNFDVCVDDGLSHNFDNKELEQARFKKAFDNSSIRDKILIDVHDGSGNFKKPEEILKEVLKFELNLQ